MLHKHMHTHICKCTHIHTYIRTYKRHTYIHIFIYTRIETIDTYGHTHAYNTYIHAYTHMHTCKYVHTCEYYWLAVIVVDPPSLMHDGVTCSVSNVTLSSLVSMQYDMRKHCICLENLTTYLD